MDDETFLKVGELAERTGVTVRTLHHYDAVGLLPPARRTASGHRLYGRPEVERLHRIRTLQSLGFSLERVLMSLEQSGFGLAELLARQAESLRRQIADRENLLRRIEGTLQRLAAGREADLQELLGILQETEMIEKHFTEEQLATLAARGESLGEDAIRASQEEWPRLIEEVRQAMAAGMDPASDEARALGARWRRLVEAFTGGDAGIERSLGNMYRQEPEAAGRFGMDSGLMGWIQEVWSQQTQS